MTVFVDNLLVWAHAKGKYKLGACHLCADTLAELHEFAAKCGFKRSWYHSGTSMPHYDLTEPTRAVAVQNGAVEVSSRELVRRFGRRSKPPVNPTAESYMPGCKLCGNPVIPGFPECECGNADLA